MTALPNLPMLKEYLIAAIRPATCGQAVPVIVGQ